MQARGNRSAQAEVARADGATDPGRMQADPIYSRLTAIHDTTLSVLSQMVSV